CSCFFFSSRRRHTRFSRDWSSDVCSSDLFGDHIAQGAARMAEWYAAVHASGGLLVQLFIAVSMYKFTICFFTVGDSLLLWKHPFKLLKSRWFSHVVIRLCFY